MNYKIEISASQSEDIIIYAKEKTPILEKIEELLSSSGKTVVGVRDDTAALIDPSDINCFYVERGRVYARTDGEIWQIKSRLYQLEEAFSKSFVKINQSCLVNPEKIVRFNTSLAGALSVSLKCGYKDYVSRRQLKEVKERIGL